MVFQLSARLDFGHQIHLPRLRNNFVVNLLQVLIGVQQIQVHIQILLNHVQIVDRLLVVLSLHHLRHKGVDLQQLAETDEHVVEKSEIFQRVFRQHRPEIVELKIGGGNLGGFHLQRFHEVLGETVQSVVQLVLLLP